MLITKFIWFSTDSNTLQSSQQTPYSSQPIQTPYNSHNKHFTILNSFCHPTILVSNSLIALLDVVRWYFLNKLPKALNSIKYLKFLTTNTLVLSIHSNTLLCS